MENKSYLFYNWRPITEWEACLVGAGSNLLLTLSDWLQSRFSGRDESGLRPPRVDLIEVKHASRAADHFETLGGQGG